MIETTFLGCPPVGLLEKSREHVQHVMFFGANRYDEYVMVNGVSHYMGTVDYSRVVIQ